MGRWCLFEGIQGGEAYLSRLSALMAWSEASGAKNREERTELEMKEARSLFQGCDLATTPTT